MNHEEEIETLAMLETHGKIASSAHLKTLFPFRAKHFGLRGRSGTCIVTATAIPQSLRWIARIITIHWRKWKKWGDCAVRDPAPPGAGYRLLRSPARERRDSGAVTRAVSLP